MSTSIAKSMIQSRRFRKIPALMPLFALAALAHCANMSGPVISRDADLSADRAIIAFRVAHFKDGQRIDFG